MFGKVRRERTEYYQKRYLDCNAKKKKNDKSYWYKKGKKKRNRNRKQSFSKKHDYQEEL